MIKAQPIKKDIVMISGTAFSTSCFAFMAAAFVILPVAASLLQHVQAPEAVSAIVIICILFGAPIAGAILGLNIGSKLVGSAEQ